MRIRIAVVGVAIVASGNARDATAMRQRVNGPETRGLVSVRVLAPIPPHFAGNIISDPASGRVWLMSYGPPANTAAVSALYEIDPRTGRVLRSATLPFTGEFGAAAYVDGFLYQVIPHESRLYAVQTASNAIGQIVRRVDLPTFADLDLRRGDRYRYPFIAFTGVTRAERGRLRLYASDIGEFITIDAQTGHIAARVATSRGLSTTVAIPHATPPALVLATFDPADAAFRADSRRFVSRAGHGVLPAEMLRADARYGHPGRRTITWTLVDPDTGEVLAATAMETETIDTTAIALLERQPTSEGPYGTLVALTLGKAGLLRVEWTPR